MEQMSFEEYTALKEKLKEMRIKALYDADVEKGALDHAMQQMSVWNTWSQDFLAKIAAEKDPDRKLKLAQKSINAQMINSHNDSKNKCPELPPKTPPREPTPEPSE